MRKKALKKYIILALVIIECISLTLMVKSFQNRKIDKTKETATVDKKKFAMYIENDSGGYDEYKESHFPDGYRVNFTKSSCVDSNGNLVEGILSGYENKVTITTKKTIYCYIYFDMIMELSELCSNGDELGNCLISNNVDIENLNDGMEGGLYRYQGTSEEVDDNYICFGTGDKSECTSNTDQYMYRIIGINEEGQLKLIKKESLNNTISWYEHSGYNVSWPNSTVYSNINGGSFLTNTTYIPEGWDDKISDTSWKYGEITILNTTANNIYKAENAWINTVNAKIGLMYVHDYYYAGGNNNCSTASTYSTCLSTWMHLSHNDEDPPTDEAEWTMSYYGLSNNMYMAWDWYSDGSAVRYSIIHQHSVRPVFYLNQDEIYVSGTGTISDPIMLSAPSKVGEYLINNPTTGLSSSKEGGLYRYQGTTADNYICFGTTDKSTCTSNTDAYMYRIMGIIDTGQVKLIKKEALNSTMAWYSSNTTDIAWPDSTVFSNINGSSFLTNNTYISSGWSHKITTLDWKYGDITSANRSASSMYNAENAFTTTLNSKIALMYAHDYYYGLSGGNNCYDSTKYETCKSSWMHLSYNDTEPPTDEAEWTMTRRGLVNGTYRVVDWYSDGRSGNYSLARPLSVRPVFYLNQDEIYVKGTGTSDDPIILNEPQNLGEYLINNPTTGLNPKAEGGLYRYQGTTADNYICFGTTDKSTCTSNTDQYMYRIMGINNLGQVKLIKKEALNSTMQWYTSKTTNITWPNSTIYSNINGSSFLTNTTYVPSGWEEKIATVSWKYGDNSGVNSTANSMYGVEHAWTSSVDAKIGLMYLHDYYFGIEGGNNCKNSDNYASCKSSWMHMSNNDTGAPSSEADWTMSRWGYSSNGSYYANDWYSDGAQGVYSLNASLNVRPVFYLSNSVGLISGTGTISDPFIIN